MVMTIQMMLRKMLMKILTWSNNLFSTIIQGLSVALHLSVYSVQITLTRFIGEI